MKGNYDGRINKEEKQVQGTHGVARGRGGGWRSTIADSLDVTPNTTSNDEKMTVGDDGSKIHDDVMQLREPRDETDEDMDDEQTDKSGEGRVIMGSEASRKAAAEYKQIVESIMTWEIVVAKHEENLKNAASEEDKARYRQNIASSKRLLAQFRREENEHFLSGSYKNQEVLLWDESDKEDEDDEELVEIVGVTQNASTATNGVRNMGASKINQMQNMEFEVDDFFGDEDDEMGEEDVLLQSGKRKEREETLADRSLQKEEAEDWKVVTNKKKTSRAKESLAHIKESRAERENVKQPVGVKSSIKTTMNMKNDKQHAEFNKKVTINTNRNTSTHRKDRDNEETAKSNARQHTVVETRSSLQRTITSYAAATKTTHNANQIRLTFSFHVRANSPSEWRQVAKILLDQSYEIDKKACIVPWDEEKAQTTQGITMEMLSNPLTMRDSMISKYFNAKGNMIPGKIYYQAGVRISTELETNVFIETWSRGAEYWISKYAILSRELFNWYSCWIFRRTGYEDYE